MKHSLYVLVADKQWKTNVSSSLKSTKIFILPEDNPSKYFIYSNIRHILREQFFLQKNDKRDELPFIIASRVLHSYFIGTLLVLHSTS